MRSENRKSVSLLSFKAEKKSCPRRPGGDLVVEMEEEGVAVEGRLKNICRVRRVLPEGDAEQAVVPRPWESDLACTITLRVYMVYAHECVIV